MWWLKKPNQRVKKVEQAFFEVILLKIFFNFVGKVITSLSDSGSDKDQAVKVGRINIDLQYVYVILQYVSNKFLEMVFCIQLIGLARSNNDTIIKWHIFQFFRFSIFCLVVQLLVVYLRTASFQNISVGASRNSLPPVSCKKAVLKNARCWAQCS